jgi:hypothetical protein
VSWGAPWSRRRRLRAVGIAILLIGLDLAYATYRIQVRHEDPVAASLQRRTAAARDRQLGILYGPTGATMIGWVDALREPQGQATVIVVLSVIGALVCFRVASLSGPDSL